jgi:hypothetical protein
MSMVLEFIYSATSSMTSMPFELENSVQSITEISLCVHSMFARRSVADALDPA